jgi:glycosyltransferase involved in cell wall biosynthesis
MRILHIITGLHPGGAEGVLARLILNDRGNEHIVVSLLGGGALERELVGAGIEVISLGLSPDLRAVLGTIRLFILIRKCKCDVVQTWMYHADLLGGIAARLAGVKAVCWGLRHSEFVPGAEKYSLRVLRKLLALLSWRLPAAVVSCSVSGVRSHVDVGYCHRKFVVIPNGFSVDLLRPASAALKSEIAAIRTRSGGCPMIASVGRYHPSKDYPTLIDALHKLKLWGIRFHCLLVGSGLDLENEILIAALRSRNLDGDVSLLGWREDAKQLLSQVDIVVSSSATEAFPNILAESMMVGTPCVATDVGDSAAIVGDYGWIVPAKSPAELADAICDALTEINTGRWANLRSACRSRIRSQYPLEGMVDQYKRLWARVGFPLPR